MGEALRILLRPAMPDEHVYLTDLCLRSKATWGYDDAFMEMCREELTVGPEDCKSPNLIVAEVDDVVVGLGEVLVDNGECFLEKLFVDPDQQRGGVGRILFNWAVKRSAELDQTEMIIEADPGAEPFYERCGATRAGSAPSQSIPGRVLPVLIYRLAPA